MLKRNGERPSSAPPPQTRLNRGEQDAYREAFEGIEDEFESLQRARESLSGLVNDPTRFAIPEGPDSGGIIEIPNVPADRWRIRSSLLKFRNSQILLCDRTLRGTKEFAVIERFNRDSLYAQANGEAEVLLAGGDPVVLVQQYAAQGEQTLQFMASNLAAKAHQIVWARYASTSPARVISIISEHCAQAASLDEQLHRKEDRPRHIESPRKRSHSSV